MDYRCWIDRFREHCGKLHDLGDLVNCEFEISAPADRSAVDDIPVGRAWKIPDQWRSAMVEGSAGFRLFLEVDVSARQQPELFREDGYAGAEFKVLTLEEIENEIFCLEDMALDHEDALGVDESPEIPSFLRSCLPFATVGKGGDRLVFDVASDSVAPALYYLPHVIDSLADRTYLAEGISQFFEHLERFRYFLSDDDSLVANTVPQKGLDVPSAVTGILDRFLFG